MGVVSDRSMASVTSSADISMTSRSSSDRNDSEKPPTKQNFFKNIRSQFSTLSLRRKSTKKSESVKSPATMTPSPSSKSDMKRRNSFNSFLRSPSNKTPDQSPRLTSTPIEKSQKKSSGQKQKPV